MMETLTAVSNGSIGYNALNIRRLNVPLVGHCNCVLPSIAS